MVLKTVPRSDTPLSSLKSIIGVSFFIYFLLNIHENIFVDVFSLFHSSYYFILSHLLFFFLRIKNPHSARIFKHFGISSMGFVKVFHNSIKKDLPSWMAEHTGGNTTNYLCDLWSCNEGTKRLRIWTTKADMIPTTRQLHIKQLRALPVKSMKQLCQQTLIKWFGWEFWSVFLRFGLNKHSSSSLGIQHA